MDNMIGNRIKERRKELNITQLQIKELLGISSGNLSGIENGRVLPSANALIGLSKILHCSVDWILTGSSELKNLSFSKNEELLLAEFRRLTLEDQNEILDLIQFKYSRYDTPKRVAE